MGLYFDFRIVDHQTKLINPIVKESKYRDSTYQVTLSELVTSYAENFPLCYIAIPPKYPDQRHI